MSNKHRKMSYSLVEETCPILDELGYELIDNLSSLIEDSNREQLVKSVIASIELIKKYGTVPLREALNDTCQKYIDLETELSFFRNATNYDI